LFKLLPPEILIDAERLGVHLELTSGGVSASAQVSSAQQKERLRIVSRQRRSDDLNELFPRPVPLLVIAPGQAEIINRKNTDPVEAHELVKPRAASCRLKPGQLNGNAVEFADNAFVHRVHQGVDAGGLGHTIFADLRPNVR
jgi:hypothetical protein